MKNNIFNFKKKILLFCVFTILISVNGCVNKQSNVKKTDDLSMYDTRYTYIEKNADDTYSMYIYTTPIQFKDGKVYKKIDNTIVEADKSEFAYENKSNSLKVFFPKYINEEFNIKENNNQISFVVDNFIEHQILGKKTSYINIYGDEREAVEYYVDENLTIYTYPINLGIHFEYVIKGDNKEKYFPRICITSDENMRIDDSTKEYLIIENKRENKFLVFQPAVLNEADEELIIDNNWILKNNKEDISANCKSENIKDGTTHIEFSIQLHKEDIPDCTAYEKKENNNYLSNYAMIGNNTELGKGLYFTRFRIKYFFDSEGDNVKSAYFCTRNLNYGNCEAEINAYYPREQWSSTRLTWENKVDYYENFKKFTGMYSNGAKGNLKFNLTDFVKSALEDVTGITESWGLVMDTNDKKCVLPSSDNGEYIPYIKIVMKNLPDNFKKMESVNDV